MPRIDPHFKLRLPDFLRERLEKEASAGRRSLTAEILSRLEMSFSDISERLNAIERDTSERLNSLEKEVFDGNRGNENLAHRVREIATELEEGRYYQR